MKYLLVALILAPLSPATSSAYMTRSEIRNHFEHSSEARTFRLMSDFSRGNPQPRRALIPDAVFRPRFDLDRDSSVPMSTMAARNRNKNNKIDFKKYPSAVDLRRYSTPVRDQGSEGLCTAFGLAAAIETLFGRAGSAVDLSEKHFWSLYQEYNVDSAMDAALAGGIIDESYWAYSQRRPASNSARSPQTQLIKQSYIGKDLASALSALSQGYPLFLGISTPNDMYECLTTVGGRNGDTGGGHAVAIMGYVIDSKVSGGGYFVVKNSWGKNCGDKGYQYMSFDVCARNGNSYCYMWSVQKAARTAN
jgi:C1A family cysteine protease